MSRPRAAFFTPHTLLGAWFSCIAVPYTYGKSAESGTNM